jgi:hypothetical protein
VGPEVGAPSWQVAADRHVGDRVDEHAEALQLGGGVQAGGHRPADGEGGGRQPEAGVRLAAGEAERAPDHAQPPARSDARPDLAGPPRYRSRR